MEEQQQEYVEQGQVAGAIPNYIPQHMQNLTASVLSEHLKVDNMLEYIEKILMGYEMNEYEEWVKIQLFVGYDKQGRELYQEQSPLMAAEKTRMLISYLKTMLHSNTFLTDIPDDEIINNMMFDTALMLSTVFYKVGDRIPVEVMETIWNSIMNSIHLGLFRGKGGRTLNALTKMQQSHEVISKDMNAPKKEFKFFG